jgi:hypothetical protein
MKKSATFSGVRAVGLPKAYGWARKNESGLLEKDRQRRVPPEPEAIWGMSVQKRGHEWLFFIFVLALFPWTTVVETRAMTEAEDDVFRQAINYIFAGRIDPDIYPEIVDRKACIVVVPQPNFNGYARYYLKRFKMDVSRISRKYAGRRVYYELEVEGDDIIFESLKADKMTVEFGLRLAHISLPGDIDQTEKALKLVFAEHCKPAKPFSPF